MLLIFVRIAKHLKARLRARRQRGTCKWRKMPRRTIVLLAPLVRRAKVVPIEAIVRGYLSGSGWAEYKRSGTVHGIQLPAGLVESQQIPGGPLFTPSTKAEQGEHDENIHPDEGA